MILTRVINRLYLIKANGILRSGKIFIDGLLLKILAKIFGFHPWHASSPVSARPYRLLIAQIVSDLHPQSVAEIGCGLGHILAHISASKLYGYDIDQNAIRAGRFLNRLYGGNIVFQVGSFSMVTQQIDVLILVNWIHALSPLELDHALTPLLDRIEYLLVDTLDQGELGFKHDFSFLSRKALLISVHRIDGEHRSFKLFRIVQ
jgi:SAM-dependent methyltransferase